MGSVEEDISEREMQDNNRALEAWAMLVVAVAWGYCWCGVNMVVPSKETFVFTNSQTLPIIMFPESSGNGLSVFAGVCDLAPVFCRCWLPHRAFFCHE